MKPQGLIVFAVLAILLFVVAQIFFLGPVSKLEKQMSFDKGMIDAIVKKGDVFGQLYVISNSSRKHFTLEPQDLSALLQSMTPLEIDDTPHPVKNNDTYCEISFGPMIPHVVLVISVWEGRLQVIEKSGRVFRGGDHKSFSGILKRICGETLAARGDKNQ